MDVAQDFAARAAAAGARTAIIAWQGEWDLTDARGFGPVRRARLLAYAGGQVISADLPGEDCDRAAVERVLRSAGLAVEVRSRNRS